MASIRKIEATKIGLPKKPKVAAYARVSTDSDEQLLSLKTQKEHYTSYIKNNPDWEFAGLYFDEGIIMLAGALLSYFLTPYIAIPTYIIWLVLFFREVHFDNHKAFEKYLLK